MEKTTAVDILDRERDILYCSIDCFLKDGAALQDYEIIDQEAFNRRHDENVDSGDHWGAFCPVCDNKFNNF